MTQRHPILAAALAGTLAISISAAAGCGDTVPDPSRTPSRSASPATSPSPAEAAARVNGVIVSVADVERTAAIAAFTGSQLTDEEALEQAVGDELVRQEAARLGVKVTAAQVDEHITAIAESVGGVAALQQALDDGGLSMADLRAGLRTVLVAEGVQETKFADLAVTREAARRYYDSHISLFTSDVEVRLGDLAVRTEGIALSARERILAGQRFDNASRQFTVDPELKAKSGMLGWVTYDSLLPPARKLVKRLKVGEMTQPVQAGQLWHVYKLYARRGGVAQPFSEVASSLQESLTQQRQAEALASWLEEARGNADIVVVDEAS